MNIYYASKFLKEYKKLPLEVKQLAEKKEKIFRDNPFEISLKTHKLSGKLKDFWSFSIDHKHRIVFEIEDNDEIWFYAVGGHEVYK